MSKFSSNKNARSHFLKEKKTFAKKSFGQNFLVDENIINKIIKALDPQSGETIFEIGSGRGALTEKILESGASVVAIELEREMIAVLKDRFSSNEKFSLIENDVLKCDFRELRGNFTNSKVKLVANLPYYISTAILQKLVEQRTEFSELILMFQREVVERLTAQAGNTERGFLTVLAEAFFEIEKLFDVSPGSFRPAPKVWSSVVRLIPREEAGILDEKKFRELISQAFRQKRKTLKNNLKEFQFDNILVKMDWDLIYESLKISPDRRAESLTLAEWKRICEMIF